MPRPIRRDIPGYARHICIRAVNGMPCFLCDFDRYVF
ncbi:MAG: transposase, partial [Verrucomicrobiae bacterium]|nr:transposase [Verrucomicrobiae bacterium]